MLKIAAFILIVFLSLPLILPRADIRDDSASAAQAAARESRTKDIIADGIDKISDFYGFDQFYSARTAEGRPASAPAAQDGDIHAGLPLLERLRLAAEAVQSSAEKQEAETKARLSVSQTAGGGATHESGLRAVFEAGIAAEEKAKMPAYLSEKDAITLNGKTYDFLRSHGKEWAITENGPVELAKFFERGAVYTGKQPILTPLPESRKSSAQSNPYIPIDDREYAEIRAGAQAKAYGAAGSPYGVAGGARVGITSDVQSNSLAGAQYVGAKVYTAGARVAVAGVKTRQDAAAPRPSQKLLAENEDYMKHNYYEPQQKADAAAAQAGGVRSLSDIRMPPPVLGKNYNVELEKVEITRTGAETAAQEESYMEK
ncbi:MAG: hypothetical protein LBG16_00380 [Elusimicrobiota bacterium]|nr:hypothetical protein [Elusimicrobiota bacterium]